jgi:hypothetical protein
MFQCKGTQLPGDTGTAGQQLTNQLVCICQQQKGAAAAAAAAAFAVSDDAMAHSCCAEAESLHIQQWTALDGCFQHCRRIQESGVLAAVSCALASAPCTATASKKYDVTPTTHHNSAEALLQTSSFCFLPGDHS